jgi:hypothetical protein
MPPPIVSCVLCGQSSTKRQTLSLKEIGLGEGRACRSHEEVVNAVEAARTAENDKRRWEEVDETLKFYTAVSGVRMMHAIHGTPTWLMYGNLKRAGYSQRLLDRIRNEVDKQGPVTAAEIDNAIFSWLALRQKELVT